jgi:small ligand-binding sensory domain FIST
MEVADRLAAAGAGGADVVFVFGSFHHRAAFADQAAIVRRGIRARHVVGVTAEWVVGPRTELEQSAGLSALALHLPGCRVTPVQLDIDHGPPILWEPNVLRQRVAWAPDTRATFLFADPFSIHAPALLGRFADVFRAPPLPIVGGLSSGSSQPGANVLVLDDEISATGAVGVTLGGPVQIDTFVSPGCRPLGPVLLVTKSKGNVLEELGGKPALDVINELMESAPEGDREAATKGLSIGIAIDEYRDRFGREDFLLRNVLRADVARRTISIGDIVRPGRSVRFHVRDRLAAVEDLELLLDREQMRDPAAAVFLATCNARGKGLFGATSYDARTIARRMNDVPLAGFFAAGEIGPVGTRSWLHGHALAAAILRDAPRP